MTSNLARVDVDTNKDALQQAGEVRHPGGEVGPDPVMAARVPEDLDRILHDLRGPLNAATMHVELLKRVVGVGSPGADSVKALQYELERLGEMITTAIGIAAVERGDLTSVDLRAVVEQALRRHELAGVEIEDAAWPRVVGSCNDYNQEEEFQRV